MNEKSDILNALRNEYNYKKVYDSDIEDRISQKLDELIIKSISKEVYFYKKIILSGNKNTEFDKNIDYLSEIDLKVNNIIREIDKLDTYSKLLLLEDVSSGLDNAYSKYIDMCKTRR